MTSTALPTIATFATFNADGSERHTAVTSASVSVSGRAGAWGVKVVISLASETFGPELFIGFVPGGRHYRHAFTTTFRTRQLAKGAAASFLADHLGDYFQGASLRINGRDKGAL